MTRDIDRQINGIVVPNSQRELSRSEQRRADEREASRTVIVPVLLAHRRGEEVIDPVRRKLKAPAIKPVSTPPRPRGVNPDVALAPARRVLGSEQEKATVRIPARTFPWQLEAVEAPFEQISIRGNVITIVDMTRVGPLAKYSARVTDDLAERADTLIKTSIGREFEEGLLFGGKILRPGRLGGQDPIFALATDGPNEARKVGVWRTRISGRERRSIIVTRSLYEDIGSVNRNLGHAGYVEPPPGSFGK